MRYLIFAFVLVSAPTLASTGDACDPNGDSTQCGEGLICTSLGVCDGPVCGDGNVVCDPSTVCTQSADCIPPCVVDGAPVYRGINSCEGRGLITTADGRCIVPCWYELCDVLRGSC